MRGKRETSNERASEHAMCLSSLGYLYDEKGGKERQVGTVRELPE